MSAIRSPYDVKMHCRLQRVQTAVHIKIRLIYTLFVIEYQLLLHTKCRVQTKQQKNILIVEHTYLSPTGT